MIDTLFNFFNVIGNALNQVTNFFQALFNFIRITVEFIPQPFLAITLIFIPIFIASIMYKILRG